MTVMDATAVARHVDAMRNAEVIAVDTETTGFLVKDGRDYLMGISVAYRLGPLGIMSAYFPFRHPDSNLDVSERQMVKEVLESKPIVFHNSKFDLHSLATFGIYPTGNKMYCTLNIAQLIDEELPSKSLDYLSQKFLRDKKSKDEVKAWADTFGWASVPANVMEPYACHDAELTLRLFEKFWPMMKEQDLVPVWPIERRWTRLLFDMERRGVGVDLDFCSAKARQGRERMAIILDDLDYDTLGPTALENLLITELGFPVLARSEKTGKPSFTKKEMEEYDEMLAAMDSPVAGQILEYRGWQKAVTSLYEPLTRLVSPDGRVRCNFKQHGTKTGRLSCAEPNLQQIPRKSNKVWNGDAKRSFLAAPGYELLGYDYAQLEFRLAAAYGQEQWLIKEFAKPDGDVFTVMAERIGVPRQVVKTFTYGTLYGAGLAKTAQTLGKPESEIEADYNSFRESIPGIRNVSRVATMRAKQRGYVKYWSGRRRHFPYAEGHHKAFNSLLQGGGAELVKQAMIRLDDTVCDDNCRIVLQVHDEVVFEIREGMRDKYEPRIIAAMTDFPQFGVNFSVEGKVWNA